MTDTFRGAFLTAKSGSSTENGEQECLPCNGGYLCNSGSVHRAKWTDGNMSKGREGRRSHGWDMGSWLGQLDSGELARYLLPGHLGGWLVGGGWLAGWLVLYHCTSVPLNTLFNSRYSRSHQS